MQLLLLNLKAKTILIFSIFLIFTFANTISTNNLSLNERKLVHMLIKDNIYEMKIDDQSKDDKKIVIQAHDQSFNSNNYKTIFKSGYYENSIDNKQIVRIDLNLKSEDNCVINYRRHRGEKISNKYLDKFRKNISKPNNQQDNFTIINRLPALKKMNIVKLFVKDLEEHNKTHVICIAALKKSFDIEYFKQFSKEN